MVVVGFLGRLDRFAKWLTCSGCLYIHCTDCQPHSVTDDQEMEYTDAQSTSAVVDVSRQRQSLVNVRF